MWGVHSQEGNEHPITFAIAKHEDGWEYHCVNKTTHQSEDGVYDDPEATAYEAMCNLLEGFGFFLTHTGEEQDYKTVVAEYAANIE